MQSIHDQQQNINSSSRSLQTKVKMANCIFGYQVKKQNFPIFHMCTAVSTKVVPQKRESVRDNADWYYG